jgi:hypothetical protein
MFAYVSINRGTFLWKELLTHFVCCRDVENNKTSTFGIKLRPHIVHVSALFYLCIHTWMNEWMKSTFYLMLTITIFSLVQFSIFIQFYLHFTLLCRQSRIFITFLIFHLPFYRKNKGCRCLNWNSVEYSNSLAKCFLLTLAFQLLEVISTSILKPKIQAFLILSSLYLFVCLLMKLNTRKIFWPKTVLGFFNDTWGIWGIFGIFWIYSQVLNSLI